MDALGLRNRTVRCHHLTTAQEGHSPVQRLLLDLLLHPLPDLLALGRVPCLQFLDDPVTRPREPFHLPQAGLGHIGNSRVRGLAGHLLVRRPFGIVHALGLDRELASHLGHGLGLLDLPLVGQHPVKHRS